jgi:hypothetical protein
MAGFKTFASVRSSSDWSPVLAELKSWDVTVDALSAGTDTVCGFKIVPSCDEEAS